MKRDDVADLPFYLVPSDGASVSLSDVDPNSQLTISVFSKMNDKTRALFEGRFRENLPEFLMFQNPEFPFHQNLEKLGGNLCAAFGATAS